MRLAAVGAEAPEQRSQPEAELQFQQTTLRPRALRQQAQVRTPPGVEAPAPV